MTSVSTSSRIRGSLYGVAVVDALGGPVEFKARGKFKLVTRYRYNSNFDLAPGTWTDDTSMTLCLAQSLVERSGDFDVHDQVRRYVRWKDEGYMSATGRCFDIGNATTEALGIWKEYVEGTGDSCVEEIGRYRGMIDRTLNREVCTRILPLNETYMKRQSSCGNGSLMRCAPIPLVYHRSPTKAQQFAAEASFPTHPHPTCLQACQIYTHLIVQILKHDTNNSKINIWNALQVFDSIDDAGFGSAGNTSSALTSTFHKYKNLETFRYTSSDFIRSSGYVVHTLEAALWAFFTSDTFAEGALKVVNLGDDADTVGAVYGGLAGAWYGLEAIPDDWVKGLQAKRLIEDVVEGIVRLVEKGGYCGE